MTINEQLQQLRGRWLLAKKEGDTKSMKIIEIRGKLLKMKGVPELDTKGIEDIFLK